MAKAKKKPRTRKVAPKHFKTERTWKNPKAVFYGTCPSCEEEIEPSCPHCAGQDLLQERGALEDGTIYYICRGCGQRLKAVRIG